MRVLIAEDDRISRRLIEKTLEKWGYTVVSCTDGNEAWETLQQQNAPRLVILDWMMPGIDGIEVCRRIRQMHDEVYRYLILLTAKSGKEDLIEGLNAGADDYLTKPFNSQELQVRLRAGRRIVELQSALLETRDKLRLQALHDPLTGLWNHGEILKTFKQELERSRRENTCVGVFMADIDHFKRVNDSHGHLAGDAVLRLLAERMQSSVRSYDSIGRVGGEEFLVVAPDCEPEEVASLAERVRQQVEAEPFDTAEGMLDVTISIGAACSSNLPTAGVEEIYAAADAALYRAKDAGRNNVQFACPNEKK